MKNTLFPNNQPEVMENQALLWVPTTACFWLQLETYELAWRKHFSVWEELQNANWTRGLWKMTSTEEIDGRTSQLVELASECTTHRSE